METCDALDSMIAGANPLLGDCTRNEECLRITCTSTGATATFLMLPCLDPVVVRVILRGKVELTEDLTMGTMVPVSLGMVIVQLNQTQEGITFGVSTQPARLASSYLFYANRFFLEPSLVTQFYSPRQKYH